MSLQRYHLGKEAGRARDQGCLQRMWHLCRGVQFGAISMRHFSDQAIYACMRCGWEWHTAYKVETERIFPQCRSNSIR